MKYIVFEGDEMIIFSNTMKHEKVAEIFGLLPISAGRIYADPDTCQCYGRSDTLDIDSRKEIDTKLLQDLIEKN